ncbi:MAG: antifreeze protein [Pseudomonadota bacterium]
MRTAHMLAEAQTVIGLRLLGLTGILPAASGENMRMVTEKQTAFTQAGLAAAGAMMAGATPAQAYGAALVPIGRATRANSRRLSRRQRS